LSGFLCKHLGLKKTVLLGVAAVLASVLFTSLSNYYFIMLFLRFILGVGIGLYLPAAISILSGLRSSKTRGKFISFHETAVPTGYIIGPTVAGFALLSGLSWGRCLQIWLIPAPFIIVALIVLLRKTANLHQYEHLQIDDGEKPVFSWFFSSFLLLLFALIFRSVVVSLIALLPLYWTGELRVEAHIAAFVFGIANIFGIFAQISAGHLSDVFGRLRVLIILNLLMTFMVAVCLSIPFSSLLIVCLIALSLTNHAFYPVVFTFVSEMAPPERKGKLLGVTIAITGFSQSLHSAVLGSLADNFGFGIAWFYAILQSCLSCLFLIAVGKTRLKN
jgi:MFS family permease